MREDTTKTFAFGFLAMLISATLPPEAAAATPSSTAHPVWSVREWRGMPGLWRDGQPVAPMIFWQWKPEAYEVEHFSAAGIDLFSFFGSFQHYDQPYWKPDGRVAPAFQDAEIRRLLSYNPRAYALPRLFAAAPEWWIQANPGEQCRYSGGQTDKPRESFASEKCREEAGRAYRRAVRHMLDADYGHRLMGIHVTNGPWGENFYWDAYFSKAKPPAASDVSEPMRQRLIKYLRAKYDDDVARLRAAWKEAALTFETVQVPAVAQRLRTNAGAWRDPQQSRAVIDYFECHNEVAVEMVDHYCRIVKEESRGTLPTAVFFGYTMDENWPIESDHRGISKLLRLGSVDILSAPHTYYRRALGEDGEMRQYLASAALHGKLFIDEGDDQTYLEKRKPKPDRRCHVNTVEETQALLYREFGNTVTHGVGLWYMDLNGGWFRDPALIETIGRMKKWADVAMNHSRRRNAQVAVISAPESEFYVGYRQTPDNEISYGLYHDQMGEFYRAGAPFDWYLIDDLDAIRDRGYRAFVFLDCFYLTDRQRAAVEALKSDGRVLLWFYAPGYASQENLSLARMEALTGFGFDPVEAGMLQGVSTASGKVVGIAKRQKSLFTVRPGEGVRELARGTEGLKDNTMIALKAHPGWTSVFSAIPGMTADQLRELYRRAGVHVYTDSGDVLSANESWLMLHTRTAGRKQIVLPRTCQRVTEITTERVIGENTRAVTIALPQYSTAVFLME
ncbi:MAG: hypothetical protein IT577_06165 [Verrucomicrobiae bacterium]|nr:hypothetical protein [Verrucomicrobiae bacterium]